MSFEFEQVKFTPLPGAWQTFTEAPEGEVGQYLRSRARKLTALAKTSVPKEHGALATSIGWSYTAVHNPFVTIGSDKSYAELVHEGSKPHLILPAPGKMLRFTIKGRVVYAREVHHPGTQPHRYLSDHLHGVVND